MEYYWSHKDNFGFKTLDTLITSNSLFIPETYFGEAGSIGYIKITPVSGPFPGEQAKPNMVGSGTGFLYAETKSIYSNTGITVGKGHSTLYKKSVLHTSKKYSNNSLENNPEDVSSSLKNKIINIIQGVTP